MKHFFDYTDLLQLLYGELDYLQKMAIEKALKEDAQLRAEWETLLMTYELLEWGQNEAKELQPEGRCLEQILTYSQNSLTTG